MYRYIVPLSALLAFSKLSTAQSSISAVTTATLLFINADPQPLVGSIIGTKGVTTTYQVQCQPGTDSTDCGFPGPFTYIKDGTSSIQYAFALEGMTASVGCSLQGTDSAACTANQPEAAVTGDDAAPTGITIEGSEAVATSTLSGTDLDYFTVPITQGASAAATAATTTAMSTAKSSGSTGGTAGLDVRTSTLALIGAAALAAVMI